jgi:hypothetical protein
MIAIIHLKGVRKKKRVAACFKTLSRHLPGMYEENHKNLSHGNRRQGRYSDMGSPEHKKQCDITSAILYGVSFLVSILEEGISIILL